MAWISRRLLAGLRLASSGLMAYKSRSAIIVFSITLGIGSVLLTLGIIQALNNEQQRIIAENGGMKTIWFNMKSPKNSNERMMFSRSPGLLADQIDKACAEIDGLDFAVPRIQKPGGDNSITHGGISYHANAVAVNHHYAPVYIRKNLMDGRFISKEDFNSGADVCMLGQFYREHFWGAAGDWKGKKVYYRGRPYEVIGILGPNDYTWAFFYPLTSHWNNFASKWEPLNKCEFMCKASSDLPRVAGELDKFFLKEHRGVRDFKIEHAEEFNKMILDEQKAARIITVLMGILALFLAIIGIVNVYLAILNEKIREIGIYKALGSSDFDIMLQFFLESLMLAIIGGICGITAGMFLVKLPFLPLKGVLLLGDYVFAMAASIIAGIAAGVFPAFVAARTSPANAMRKYT